MRKPLNRVINHVCKKRLFHTLPEIEDKLLAYSKGSETTGTQWTTLWFAVDAILKTKPLHILECGTGSSTLVLAEAVRLLQIQDQSYHPLITSMESVDIWFETAKSNLPAEYSDIVEILYGPRKKFEWAMYRGYIHDNIPDRPFEFIFLDGPGYDDEFGTSFCADVLFVANNSKKERLTGVIDGRTSSAFVLQNIFGVGASRYFLPNMACKFNLDIGRLKKQHISTDFYSNLFGALRLK